MHATTVAIDLAKGVFELAFADSAGHILERKRLTRRTFSRAMENRAPLTVVMEACGSAHYWGATSRHRAMRSACCPPATCVLTFAATRPIAPTLQA